MTPNPSPYLPQPTLVLGGLFKPNYPLKVNHVC
jgi:hypothetical protein